MTSSAKQAKICIGFLSPSYHLHCTYIVAPTACAIVPPILPTSCFNPAKAFIGKSACSGGVSLQLFCANSPFAHFQCVAKDLLEAAVQSWVRCLAYWCAPKGVQLGRWSRTPQILSLETSVLSSYFSGCQSLDER